MADGLWKMDDPSTIAISHQLLDMRYVKLRDQKAQFTESVIREMCGSIRCAA
jgi:hypothetical protein